MICEGVKAMAETKNTATKPINNIYAKLEKAR